MSFPHFLYNWEKSNGLMESARKCDNTITEFLIFGLQFHRIWYNNPLQKNCTLACSYDQMMMRNTRESNLSVNKKIKFPLFSIDNRSQ